MIRQPVSRWPAPPTATAARAAPIHPVMLALAAMLVLAPVSAFAQPPMNLAEGQTLYESKCGGCHSLDENRVGPRHRGVVGRKVASLTDYDYSPAIRKLSRTWTEWTPERIDQWLQGPQKVAPGAKMFFEVPDPAQRTAIVAYLAANSPPAK